MKVVVSIHDITPFFQKEIESILKKLEHINKSLLITPLWHGSNQFSKSFAQALSGEDKVLHGLTHQGKKDPFSSILFRNASLTREFRGLNETETSEKLEEGIKLFEDSFHERPKGFIPPMWYHNQYSLPLLNALGFIYTESWTQFIDINNDRTWKGLPMSFDYGNNYALSRFCLWYSRQLLTWSPPGFVRFAIHPQDVQHGFLNQICDRIKLLVDRGYQFYSYQDLIQSE